MAVEAGNQGDLNAYHWLHKTYGPACGVYIGAKPVLMVFDPDLVQQILVKEFSSFVDRPLHPFLNTGLSGLPLGVFEARGDKWRRARRAISPVFTSKKMKMLEPHMQRSCNILMKVITKAADSDKSVDVLSIFRKFTLEVIVAVVFGQLVNIQYGEHSKFTKAATDILEAGKNGLLTMFFSLILSHALDSQLPLLASLLKLLKPPKLIEAFQILFDTTFESVKSRRQSRSPDKSHKDFLQMLIDDNNGASDNGKQTESNENIVSHCINFLLAGYETTALTLSYTSYLLATNPEVQDTLITQIDECFQLHPDISVYDAALKMQYLDMVVQETLRIYPPTPSLGRLCTEDVLVQGLRIPKGMTVVMPIIFLHHNPETWGDPENFRPERFSLKEKEPRPQCCHIPFGAGSRNCVGMKFALTEIKMAIIEILIKYKFVVTPETETPLHASFPAFTTVPKNGVYLGLARKN